MKERRTTPEPPTLEITAMAYGVRTSHDLGDHREVFGLTASMSERPSGHFPGISGRPVHAGSAKQGAMARFGARGFEAAAVTAFGMAGAGPSRARWVATTVEATFDRPFGFLAVHRHTRLVLAAGWVMDPEPFREDEAAY